MYIYLDVSFDLLLWTFYICTFGLILCSKLRSKRRLYSCCHNIYHAIHVYQLLSKYAVCWNQRRYLVEDTPGPHPFKTKNKDGRMTFYCSYTCVVLFDYVYMLKLSRLHTSAKAQQFHFIQSSLI